MNEPLAKDQDKFVLRLPAGMRDRIKAAADVSNRSMNAEIVATLEEKYPPEIEFDHDEFVDKWIVPILEMDEMEIRARAELIARADRAARLIHPNLGVWERATGKRDELVFGVRDLSLLPPGTRATLQSFISRKGRPDR